MVDLAQGLSVSVVGLLWQPTSNAIAKRLQLIPSRPVISRVLKLRQLRNM